PMTTISTACDMGLLRQKRGKAHVRHGKGQAGFDRPAARDGDDAVLALADAAEMPAAGEVEDSAPQQRGRDRLARAHGHRTAAPVDDVAHWAASLRRSRAGESGATSAGGSLPSTMSDAIAPISGP